MILVIGRAAVPVIAGLALAGCMGTPPMQQYPAMWGAPGGSYAPSVDPYRYYPPPGSYLPTASATPKSGGSWVSPRVAPPAPPASLRPIDPPEEQPIDPSCGWWRLCNLWSGSS